MYCYVGHVVSSAIPSAHPAHLRRRRCVGRTDCGAESSSRRHIHSENSRARARAIRSVPFRCVASWQIDVSPASLAPMQQDTMYNYAYPHPPAVCACVTMVYIHIDTLVHNCVCVCVGILFGLWMHEMEWLFRPPSWCGKGDGGQAATAPVRISAHTFGIWQACTRRIRIGSCALRVCVCGYMLFSIKCRKEIIANWQLGVQLWCDREHGEC